MTSLPTRMLRCAARAESRALLAVIAATTMLSPTAAHAQDLVPPHVISIEDVTLPEGAVASDAIDVVVVIAADGAARVASCAHDAPICDAASEAIGRSRFAPATRDGVPIAARIGVQLRPRSVAPTSAEPEQAVVSDAAPAPPAPDAPRFRAVGRVDEVSAGARRFELAETRDVPGTMGDPMRALESLPGVVPVMSGFPYVFVRGSPPAGTLYSYDGIPLPQLFHLALGPSVIHPRMLGAMQLHAGVAPARWGRHIGGVILAEGPDDDAQLDGPHGEAELRLLDVSGFVQAPVLGGSVAAAVRFGWPGLIASAVVPSLVLGFGDYQLRATMPIGGGTHAQLVALGSYDRLAYAIDDARTSSELSFHRLEGRILHREGGLQLLAALRFGWDRSIYEGSLESPMTIETGQVAPRIAAQLRDSIYTLRVGADAIASFGRNPDVTLWAPSDPIAHRMQRAIGRSIAGVWVELELRLDPNVTLELGVRGDVWITADHVEGALDPRVKLTVRPTPELTLHAGAGVTRQPPAYYLPLPGTGELSLAPGLQTAMQSDVGALFEHEWLRAELQVFLHRYEDLVFSDFFALAGGVQLCFPGLEAESCYELDYQPQTNGLSWGGELLVAIAPTQPLSGWLSYTLAWAEVDPIFGLPFRPSYDVRHVLNLVLRWELGEGFSMGARVHLRSGGSRGLTYADVGSAGFVSFARREEEMPAFFRADASVAYRWDAGWARFRVALEWLNLTISEEPVGIDCDTDPSGAPTACRPEYAPPIFAPNLGLRMEL